MSTRPWLLSSLLSVLLSASPALAQSQVLLLWDVDDYRTQGLVDALTTAGLVVTLADTDETQYDGTNPDPTGFDVVLHLNGTTYNDEMPQAGQIALVDFVAAGGGFIHTEWDVHEYGEVGWLQDMGDLLLFDWSSGRDGALAYTVVAGQEGHPVMANVPASFGFIAGANVGGLHVFASDPATELMTDDAGSAAVAVREWGAGRIVGFNHAGNYASLETLLDANVQQLFVDGVMWAAGEQCADADGDGYLDDACGGDDCDDADPNVSPGTSEQHDGLDQDCDGLIDEGALPSDALVLTEIMADPDAVTDDHGEWFELYNNTAVEMNLIGMVVYDLGSNSFTVDEELLIAPAEYAVLGVDGDTGSNGGVDLDHEWSSFYVGNSDDEIYLEHDGIVLDSVEYDGGALWIDPTGASMSLDPASTDPSLNDDPDAWCEATTAFGQGDLGTPGEANPDCETGDDDDSVGDDDDATGDDDDSVGDDDDATGDDDDSVGDDDDATADDDDATADDDDSAGDDDDSAGDDDDATGDDDTAADDDTAGDDCECDATGAGRLPSSLAVLLLAGLAVGRRVRSR